MAKYRIKEIVLSNITSHRNTVLDEIPSHGSLALVGPNGAGKSSLIEAVQAALTLKPLRDNIVRYGSTHGEIRIVLESDKDIIESKVVFHDPSRRKTKEALLKRNGKPIASTPTSYLKEVAGLLNAHNYRDLEGLLTSTTIIPQGKLREIAEDMDKPRDFKTLVENAIGLPDYKKAIEEIKEVRLNVEDVYFQLPTISSKDPRLAVKGQRYQELSRSIESKHSELNKLKENLRLLKQKISEYEDQLKSLDVEIEKLKSRINGLRERRTLLQNEVTRLTENLRVLENKRSELESARRALAEAKEAADLLPRLEEVSRLSGDVDKLRELEKKRLTMEVELSQLESILGDLEEVAENRGSYDEYSSLREESERLADEYKRLISLKSRLEAQLEELRKTRARAESLSKTTSALLGVTCTGDLESDYERIVRAVNELRAERDRLDSAVESLNQEESLLRDRVKETREILEALKRSTQPKCPVCGRDLDEEHKRALTAKLEEELGRLTSRLTEIQAEKRGVKEKLKALESKTDAAAMNVEKLKSYLEALKEGDPAGKKSELDSVNEEYESLQRRLMEVKEKLGALEASADKYKRAYSSLLKRGVNPEDHDKYRSQLMETARAIDQLASELEGLKRRILSLTGKGGLEEAIGEIERARDQVAALRAKTAMIGELEARVRELEEELRGIDRLTSEIGERQSELGALQRELEALEAELEEAEAKRSGLTRELGRLEAEITHHDKEVARLEGEIRKLNLARDKMMTGIMAGAILLDTQERILESARAALETAMSEILDKFKLDYHAVSITEVENGFELRVHSRNNVGGERGLPVSQLSGGEKTALALAFVIALQHILALNLGFLILDEPTSELDSDRRDALMDLIQSLSSEGIVDQLIVITHHEDVVDKVDKTCRVEKTDSVSRLECLREEAF